jgi:hypothetical protein
MNILISQKSAKKCKNIEKLDEKQTKKKSKKKQFVFIEYKNDDYMYTLHITFSNMEVLLFFLSHEMVFLGNYSQFLDFLPFFGISGFALSYALRNTTASSPGSSG